MKQFRTALLLLVFCLAAMPSEGQVRLIKASRITVGPAYDSLANPVVRKKMKRFQDKMAQTVGRVIGTSETFMDSKAPESLLSNFLSDQLRLKAAEFTGKEVDAAVLNLGGIRAPMPSGTITVGDIYRIMPFENELVILELKGSDLLSIVAHVASEGGEGVSGIRMRIASGKPNDVVINGQPIDENRIYRIATMDYLANGNSGMTAFLKAVSRTDTHIKVRDAYISRIESITAEGKKLTSAFDGRITLKKD